MRTESLRYAVRPAAVTAALGQLVAVLAALTMVPALVAAVSGEWGFAARCGVVAVLLGLIARLARQCALPARLQRNEALAASVLLFLLAPLAMAYPLASGGLAPLDAWFEATSAVTTTGLSTVANPEEQSRAFLFTRAWMQWYGGLGFVILSVALVVRPGALARQLDASGGAEGELFGNARAHGRAVLKVYAALTLAGFALFLASGLPGFDALLHVLASVSTGGFSSRDASLAGLGSWPSQLTVLLVCAASAVPLAAYYRAHRSGWHRLAADRQLRALVAVIALLAIATAAILWGIDGMAPAAALRHGVLQVISAQSTAGFSTVDVGAWSPAAKLTLVLAMFVGGGAGSTAGGVKLLRVLAALQVARSIVRSAAAPPHAVVRPQLGAHPIADEEARDLVTILVLFIAVIALSWMAFVVAGFEPIDALFEVVSATGTVGLSTGVTHASLPAALKVVLCADMLLGRLEIVAVLVALHPRTWIGRRTEL